MLMRNTTFGGRFKQRGKEAETACNVFYHLTYEGAVDLDRIQDPTQLKVCCGLHPHECLFPADVAPSWLIASAQR